MKNNYLSPWAKNVSPSPTLAVDAKAKALKAAGEDVCGFGAGEPDFDTPAFIKEACAKALAEGKTKYAPAAGIPDLRQALADQYHENGVLTEANSAQVVVSPGGKYSCYLAILATCGPGDEVIVPAQTHVATAHAVEYTGAKVKFINKRNICGEPVADICVKSQKNLKSINCPIKYNSNAIDEFLIIFLLASKAYGVSNFKKLEELNKKESPRLKLASLMLRKIGVTVKSDEDSIKIFGNPRLNINKKILINRYYKDHRVFMTSVIAALTLGGNWTIHDMESHMSSFPSFLSILRKIGYRFI